MPTKQDIYEQLESLVGNAHKYACSLDIGADRTDAFELYEALRRLQRRGAAGQMLAATNPLLTFFDDDEEDDWDYCDAWDEEDDE